MATARIQGLSAALKNRSDSRHALADSVLEKSRRDKLDRLPVKTILKLMLEPKWRYLPEDLRWLVRRLKHPQNICVGRGQKTGPPEGQRNV